MSQKPPGRIRSADPHLALIFPPRERTAFRRGGPRPSDVDILAVLKIVGEAPTRRVRREVLETQAGHIAAGCLWWRERLKSLHTDRKRKAQQRIARQQARRSFDQAKRDDA